MCRASRAVDDRREVVAQFGGRQAPQSVVAAERHDQDSNVALERPVEPPQPPGRRVTRDARVDDVVAQTGRAKFLLDERGVRLRRSDSEPRGQAVTETHDAGTCGRVRRNGGRLRAGCRCGVRRGGLPVAACAGEQREHDGTREPPAPRGTRDGLDDTHDG